MRPIKVSEEVYTHEYLWRAAETLHKTAPLDRRYFHYRLSALMMAYLAFEAFINFIGEIMCPSLWANEKDAFRGKGDAIEAKIDAIVRQFPGYEWRKGERPYQDVKRLKRFRDLVTHGKVIRSEYVAFSNDDEINFRWTHEWDDFIEPEQVARSMSSIKTFSQSLLIEARKYSDEPHLVFDAFEGALASAEGTSRPR